MVTWGIPLRTSGIFHCIDHDWLLVSEWRYFIIKTSFSLALLEGLHWVTTCFIFVFPLDGLRSYVLLLFYISSSHRARVDVFGVMNSFKPGWLCGSSLDKARGVVCVIVDGWAVFEVISVPIICSTGVLGLRGVGFGFSVKVSGAELGIGGGVVDVSSFLRNRRFLKVILPYPSTLTRYWWLGSVSTTWPVGSLRRV